MRPTAQKLEAHMRWVSIAAIIVAVAAATVSASTLDGASPSQSTPPTPTRTLGIAPNPTSTRTPSSSVPPTRTATPTATRTSTRTAVPSSTATARATATSTPAVFQIATPTRTSLPVTIPTPDPTDLPVTVPTPEPTDLPLAVPPPTSTPPQITAGEVPDLVATAIEVTQGMQNLANDMPLVSERLTAARVYVRTQDPDAPVANVKAALAGIRNGQLIGIEYPQNGPIVAVPEGGLRTNVDDSLWFYLPGAWTTDGPITLRAFVYSTTPDAPFKFEPDAMNNVREVDVEFLPANPLKVRLVPLHTHTLFNPNNADKTYHYDDHEFEALQIILDILRLHPIATNGLSWNASSTLILEDQAGQIDIQVSSIKPIGHQDGVEWDLTGTDKGLANERTAFFKANAPPGYDDFHWYGMVDPSHCLSQSCGITGWASSDVALGKMDVTTPDAPWDVIGGYVLSHEIAHLLLSGDDHINCTGNETSPDLAYPYGAPNCSLAAVDPEGWYGFDVYWPLWGHYLDGPTAISNDPSAAWPSQAFPMMGSKSPQYVDPWDYCRLLDSHGIPCDHLTLGVAADPGLNDRYALIANTNGPQAPSPANRAQRDPLPHDHPSHKHSPIMQPAAVSQSGAYAYVSALVDPAAGAAQILEVMPLIDVAPGVIAASQARRAEAALSSQSPEYELLLEDAAGNPLASYAITPTDSSTHDEPVSDASILFADAVEYPEATAAVRVRRGGGGGVLAERIVSATAPVVQLLSPNGGEQLSGQIDVRWQASDADGDALTFTLMYSADGGASWEAVATDLRGDQATLASPAGLAGSRQALFRIIASDGMRTAHDDSDAALGVPDSAPLPYIIGPAGGASSPEGATVILLGGANDLEDGAIGGASLRWRSSIDGDLGAGSQISKRDLSRGRHDVTLTVTDSAGNVAERAATITIAEAVGGGVPGDDEQSGIMRGLGLSDGDDGGGSALWIAVAGGAAAAAAASVAGFALARSRRRHR